MSAGEMSDGSPVTPQLDARMLAELREWRRRLAPTSLDGNRWSARLTIDELDMLLRAAAERDALKAAACAEWEADIPAEIRARAAATPAVEGCPRRGTIHDCPLGGCPTPVRHVNAPCSVEPVLGREARETPPPIPWPATMIAAHGHDGTATDAEREHCPICNGVLDAVPTPVYPWRATGCAWGGDRMGAEAAMRHYARMHGGRLERRVAAGPWTVTS